MNSAFCAPASQCELTDRFEERQPFDVADRAADLDDHHVGITGFADFADPRLDLVGHVRE